ncbi:hypothetical protein [Aeoliella sp.]|uniref:hypothetical protein n=1 Tax=Aeoliella sp. TaxID=2795800 RepID=UPI003CCBECF4
MNHRRFQFGLRDLFWLMLVFSLIAAWWHGSQRFSAQLRSAENRIQKLEQICLEIDAHKKLRAMAEAERRLKSLPEFELQDYLD